MLERSTVSGKGYSGVRPILQPGMTPPPPEGYSFSFDVSSDPMIVMAMADAQEAEDWEATVQISPDGGETFTDLVIHSNPVVLNAANTLLRLPVSGVYRLRTTTFYVTYAIYSVFMSHEQDMPLVNLARPGPQGIQGPVGPQGIQGERGPQGPAGDSLMLTPLDFGAAGDGITDDGPALQAWLDAIKHECGFGSPGTYLSRQKLKIYSGTTIFGCGKTNFIIRLKPNETTGRHDKTLLEATLSPLETRTNAISIYNTCFEGDTNAIVDGNIPLVAFPNVYDTIFRDCLFQHWRWIQLSFDTAYNTVIDNCEFTDWGDNSPVPPPPFDPCTYGGGQCLYLGNAMMLTKVINCNFHDGHWTSIETTIDSTQIIELLINNCEFKNIKETAIYGGGDFITITNNRIHNLTNKACSGTGMEIGGNHLTVHNNCVNDTSFASISLQNAAHAVVTNNTLSKANQLLTAGVFSEGAGVLNYRCFINRTTPAHSDFAHNIIISNNNITGNDNKSSHAISLFTQFGGGPVDEVTMMGNNFGASADYLGDTIYIQPAVLGTQWLVKNNNKSTIVMDP